MHDIFFPLINGFFAVLKSFKNILKHYWNAWKSQGDPQKSYEEFGIFGGVFDLVNSWAVWPLTTIFGVPGVFLAVSRVFRSIMGGSRGVPGLFRLVSGCSGLFRGCSGGVPGMFRGVPGVLQTPRFAVEGYNVKYHSVGRCLSSRDVDCLLCWMEVFFFRRQRKV